MAKIGFRTGPEASGPDDRRDEGARSALPAPLPRDVDPGRAFRVLAECPSEAHPTPLGALTAGVEAARRETLGRLHLSVGAHGPKEDTYRFFEVRLEDGVLSFPDVRVADLAPDEVAGLVDAVARVVLGIAEGEAYAAGAEVEEEPAR